MSVRRISIASERGPYAVLVGTGAARSIGRLLQTRQVDPANVLVISSRRVWRLHGRRLAPLARRGGVALMGDGERAKTLETVEHLYAACLERKLDRSATIVAFGGGVVGDVAGFVAATYLRGVRLIQIPTTLLAQVDSAIGGKVGVNLAAGKNLVGAFHAPDLVICDPQLLATLPAREFRAGLYEVVKYGVIADPSLFRRVAKRLPAIVSQEPALLSSLVADCCRIKADVVTADEREGGRRRVLNFGHTVGHALEALTGYRRFRHGEAIGYGMLAAAFISASRGLLSHRDHEDIRSVIGALGRRPPVADLRIQDALAVIGRDKKIVDGRLHFVLARGIGSTVEAVDVTGRELTTAMRAIGMKG
jgi:3-dehydroquinate synthase